jgi:DNA-binding protein HU-beta
VPEAVNELLPFIEFVEHHPLGTSVNAVVESYSSHGAYVTIEDVRGYVPLQLISDPPPRSARKAMAVGDAITLVVASFSPARRSIDLAFPAMAASLDLPEPLPVEAVADKKSSVTTTKAAAPSTRKAAAKKTAEKTTAEKQAAGKKAAATKSTAKQATASTPTATATKAVRTTKKAAANAPPATTSTTGTPAAKRSTAKRSTSKRAATPKSAATPTPQDGAS